MTRLIWSVTAIAALALVATDANAQSFDGATVNYQYYFPDLSTPCACATNGNYVVGSGVEISNIADNTTGGLTVASGTMDISANDIFIDFLSQGSFNAAAFNGFVLSDLTDNLPAITGVTINPATNMAGFGNSNVSFTGDSILVNWADLAFNAGTVVSLNVTFAQPAVPEPATWAMMLVGLGAIGCTMRLRRRRAQRGQTA
jgi:hypothetical protein